MKIRTFGKSLSPLPPKSGAETQPDWVQANPRWIRNALEHSQKRPSGGWYVLGATRELKNQPRKYTVAGSAFVAFRSGGAIIVGPDRCPHMGAALTDGRLEGGQLVCPWHGLRLGCEARGSWQPRPVFDDGVLLWVRLDEFGEQATDRPVIAPRPRDPIDIVVSAEAECEPRDVIANRLDPWHGAHFHPYAFARLRVLEKTEDDITVRVAKRVLGPMCVEVDARFHCPEPRTIVMTIVAGEGEGSVVETHATPMGPGRTMVIEANLAQSSRKGFAIARGLAGAIRPLMVRSARRLWRDDIAYAERLYAERKRPRSITAKVEADLAPPTLESSL